MDWQKTKSRPADLYLMYSDDIKANMLAYGEKSDVVLACQQRLKDLAI